MKRSLIALIYPGFLLALRFIEMFYAYSLIWQSIVTQNRVLDLEREEGATNVMIFGTCSVFRLQIVVEIFLF